MNTLFLTYKKATSLDFKSLKPRILLSLGRAKGKDKQWLTATKKGGALANVEKYRIVSFSYTATTSKLWEKKGLTLQAVSDFQCL